MTGILHAIVIIAIIAAVLFVLSFAVYFFNLDMKLTAALAPILKSITIKSTGISIYNEAV